MSQTVTIYKKDIIEYDVCENDGIWIRFYKGPALVAAIPYSGLKSEDGYEHAGGTNYVLHMNPNWR